MIRRMPARRAAKTFSLSPPIGKTRPESVISPVIAVSARIDLFKYKEASAVVIVIPADGPSLGTAPEGTCKCSPAFLKTSRSIPKR